MAERGIGHRLLERRIVDAVELEREEQHVQRGRRDALLHVAVELRAHRVRRVARIDKARERNEPAEQVVEGFVALHRLGEPGACERGELALVSLLERDAFGVGAVEVALHLRRIDRGVEVGEIPFGQRTERPALRGG